MLTVLAAPKYWQPSLRSEQISHSLQETRRRVCSRCSESIIVLLLCFSKILGLTHLLLEIYGVLFLGGEASSSLQSGSTNRLA